jgi:hypothetical protein
MSASTLRILIALFLIAHGLVHYSLTTVPVPAPGALRTPFFPSWWRTDVDSNWLASLIGLPDNLVRTFGWLLWVALLVAFALGGLGLIGVPGLNSIWQTLLIFGSVISLILLAFYWHPWLVLGVLINLVVMVCIWRQLPAFLFQR